MKDTCALCETSLSLHPIREGENAFCCTGCHAVFNILSAKSQLENYQEHPLFHQAVRAGLISNPLLLEKIRRNRAEVPEEEIEKLHLEVEDMWCPACAEVIRLVLLQEKGVRNCVVDYATDLASIEFSPRFISKERIYTLIKAFGYHPVALDSSKNKVGSDLYFRFAVAAFCTANIMMFAYPIYASYFDFDADHFGSLFAWISCGAALPVVGYSGWPILRRFTTSLQVGLFGMETLVVISVATAFGLSIYDLWHGGTRVYFDSLSVIITFVLLGKIIETKAKFSAKDSLWRLARAIPKRARKLLPDGSASFLPIKEIHPGDTVVALCGEKIALDGEVVSGEGACDESLMTGESLPVSKRVGSLVLGGSILKNGRIAFRVSTAQSDTALQRIIDMVQHDIGHKSVYIRAADSIVRWFVPGVISIAIVAGGLSWLFGIADPGQSAAATAIIRAISVLLISCPCAIGIAAPLAESHLLNGLAKMGAIVRNRGCLSVLGKETVFVFDKTGTITEGRFTVVDGLHTLSLQQLSDLKGLASQSIHPISVAIAEAIEAPATSLDRVEEFSGQGLKGKTQYDHFHLGSAEFLLQNGIEVIPRTEDSSEIYSTVYFAVNHRLLATLILGDRIREGAKETIEALHPIKTILISGDSSSPVAAVARACGFKEWHASCNPLQKRERIEQLRRQGDIVCMVGDGINDAPALTAANVGISVVSATEISIQVSDLLLTTDKLQVIHPIRSLAKKGHTIVQQNLFWAFFYNVIGIGLAAAGVLSPLFAAFAMVVSSLTVLFNSKRVV